MLRTTPKGEPSNAVPLLPEEDRLLRRAFGLLPMVARYQQLRSGRYFPCGCRPGAEHLPALVHIPIVHVSATAPGCIATAPARRQQRGIAVQAASRGLDRSRWPVGLPVRKAA